MDEIEIEVRSEIPEKLIPIIDSLLAENGSYNRIGDTSSLPDDIQDCLYNKHDRVGYVLAYHGDTVVGTVIIFKREIQFHDQLIVLGGIGGVGTRKDYRKKGIGTKMLVTAMKRLEELGSDSAFLRTDTTNARLVTLYKNLGFVELGRSDTYTGGISGKQYTDFGGMIAPIRSQEKFQRILEDTAIFDQGIGTW